jgi:2-amino-4-hydroxy-6-hydroxymethyldihydropteridine diphosphokinase
VLPHPRLHERAFVLLPLAEIAPGWRHPVLGRSAPELLAALPPGQKIVPLDGPAPPSFAPAPVAGGGSAR